MLDRMATCSCCGTHEDPQIGKPLPPYNARSTCAYCAGFPHTTLGRCWGYHGKALEHYLDGLVRAGRLSSPSRAQALLLEQQRLLAPCS